MAEPSLEGMTSDAVQGLAILAKQLSDNPDTRAEFLKLTKKVNPTMAIPEVDMPVQMASMLDVERKKREELEGQILKDRVERQVMERRSKLKSDNSFSDTDINAIEKLMVDENIASHETAAKYYKMSQKAAEPTPSFAKTMSFEMPNLGDKEVGSKNFARNEAARLITGFRNGTLKPY